VGVGLDAPGVVIRLHFRNASGAAVHLEQLRPLVAPRGFGALPLQSLRIAQLGWQSWSRSHPAAPFEPNVQTAAPPIRGPLLNHRQPDSQLEPWMTVLSAPDNASLLVGFASARDQLGTIEIIPTDGGGHQLIAATELDGIALPPSAEIRSEPLLLASGAEPDLFEHYARSVATTMAARPARPLLTGWCSWYQLYTDVSEADVDRNVTNLAAHRAQLPLQLIQLDDGYQAAVGDWLDVLPKFSDMPALVRRIRDQGYVPGVWLAPFIVSARSRTFAAHPDWVVRDDNGQPLNALDNWGSANYALDTTHPGVLEWLAEVLRTVCDGWGFQYLKLDFLYAAAMRGRRHDADATAVQAYRRGLQLLRDVAGERFILGCGAPLLPSVGLVDGMRIGSDVAAYWGREGNADGPSLRNATRATLARMWLHGFWWANDPDCVVVRATDTQLSLAEVQAWSALVALSGGMVFVGDDVSRVEPERLELLARLFPPSGVAARVCPPLHESMPERLVLRVKRTWATWHVVAVANWGDVTVPTYFDPFELGLPAEPYHAFDLWRGDYLGRHSASLTLAPLAPHSLHLLSIHPDLGRPQTIGSTGHLLGPAQDLADEAWDAVTRELTLRLSPHGPPARRGELIVCDPNGPPRRVAFASTGAQLIRLLF
ncbi:MAG TPA: glycoside hydrolase family 36 protein, partial [Chloroflexota bacterium]